MIPMTVKEFDSLCQRDFENGAVRDSIRIALKERESLLTPIPKEKKKKLIDKYMREIEDDFKQRYTRIILTELLKAYDELKEEK